MIKTNKLNDEIVRLLDTEEFTLQEIADKLSCSIGHVYNVKSDFRPNHEVRKDWINPLNRIDTETLINEFDNLVARFPKLTKREALYIINRFVSK